MTPSFRIFLNLARWFAAFLVLISHVRHLVLVDYQYVADKNLVNKALYFVTGFGHEAVVFFFVISGFLVGGISIERWRAHGPQLLPYASARISRLYTVLVPALLLGLLLDVVGLRWFNASELYTNSMQYRTISLNHPIDACMTVATFFGNLFMLQGIATPTFGSNNPLWSLSYEWWYYCIFALLGWALTGRRGLARTGAAVGAVALLLWLPDYITLWGIIWLLGLLAYVWGKSAAWRPPALVSLLLFVALLVYLRINHTIDPAPGSMTLLATFLPDLYLGLAWSLALASCARLRLPLPGARWHARLADFSYTTYLLHFPVMIFVVAVAAQVFGMAFQVQPGVGAWSYTVGLCLLLYLVCFLVSQATERYTQQVKEWLDRRFMALRREPPAPGLIDVQRHHGQGKPLK